MSLTMLGDREIRLVEAARTGDLDSFGKLCEALYAPTVAIAYAVLADHHHRLEGVRQAAQVPFLWVGECHGASGA